MRKYIFFLLSTAFISLLACQPEAKNPKHLWHDIPAITEDGFVNAVIEIPAGSDKKYEVNKTNGRLEWEVLDNGEKRQIKYLAYPANYGMVPQTYLPKHAGGDGDPLDIIVLGPAYDRGSIIQCKLIGVLFLKDHGENDDKLIAVPHNSIFSQINNLDELEATYPGIKTILLTWFTNYKGKNKMQSDGWGNADASTEILKLSMEAYSIKFNN